MRVVVWIGIATLATALVTGLAAGVGLESHVPDLVIVVLAFLALRASPLEYGVFAWVAGYIVGRQAAAPVGVHEFSLMATAVAMHVVVGNITGRSRAFFAMACALALVAYHGMVYVLLLGVRGTAGFASFADALLVHNALLTGAAGALLERWLARVDTRLVDAKREELSWR